MYYFCFVLYHLYIGCLLKMIYSFFTFMVAYCLDIDGMGALSIDIVILIFVGRLNPHMGPVDTTYNTREPSLLVKSSFDVLNFSRDTRAFDTSVTILETVDLGRPTVSPIICRKLPLAKKRNATRTCSVGDSAWFLRVCLCRSSFRISTRNFIDSRPNLYLLRSSSSVSSSRSISRCWNFLSRICGSIRGNSKSAILFVLAKFSPD